MYLPKHFSQEEWTQISDLVKANGFATVLSFPKNENTYINHLPLVFDQDSEKENALIGHMAKRNPQWMHFKENPNCTVIFHGPHTYITPTWYKSGRDVPTWNYTVVHMHGKIELLESFDDQINVLEKLTQFYEGSGPRAWQFELPDDLLDAPSLTSAIISFRFRPEKIEAKFKLSQNRVEIDRQGIIQGLGERKDEMSHAIRRLMMENRN